MVPIPRIVGKSRPTLSPIPPGQNRDINLSPIMHRRSPTCKKSFDESASKESEPLEETLVLTSSKSKKTSESVDVPTFTFTERKPVVQHAKSLDDLLCAHRPIIIVLNSDKRSKYSRLTITASMNMYLDDPDGNEPSTFSASGNSKSECDISVYTCDVYTILAIASHMVKGLKIIQQ